MKTLTYRYNVELDWVDEFAKVTGGNIKGNFIESTSPIRSGIQYFSQIDSGISAVLTDLTYAESVMLKEKNYDNSFVQMYHYITEGDINVLLKDKIQSFGKWDYNMSIIDSSLDLDYRIEKGCRLYFICIFIKKALLKKYLEETLEYKVNLDHIFDSTKNTIIRFDRMSNESRILINNLRKLPYEHSTFNIAFKSVVFGLIGHYLEGITVDKFIIGKMRYEDLKLIIASQAILLDHIKDAFPGIEYLATEACMSATKYKKLYKKVTGLNPNEFYLKNKMELAKELLESGNHSISEVVEQLNYTSVSYLAKLFKDTYGILPKDYLNNLS
ncbi:helix-turn-helix domain-containing protein [Flavobacterium sp. '19STA2R22 D10 B1']|uniref:helix-turn-helix domain-containing protein n=1 Tax=Flavobacterium aerium TaxID=3037261 RepID=UPI00278C644D|nr:helix-turn-helix transcriptional regulator [Flavobacterium sp. '19STA2R22 D10 B1']